MSADNILVLSIGLILVLILIVAIVDYLVIINLKIDFDLICRKYFWIAEGEGGLKSSHVSELKKLLQTRGFKNIEIVSPKVNETKYGDEINIKIKSTKEFKLIKKLFVKEKENIDFIFNKTTISRRIIN